MSEISKRIRMKCPSGKKLWNEYLRFNGNRQPCRREIVVNQCAVRMSVALAQSDCDFNFSQWTHGLVHDQSGVCRNIPPHVTNATNLSNYLGRLGLHFESFRKSNTLSSDNIRQRIRGRMGIIYFPNCFTGGSHIDFWTGSNFMNEILRVSAGGGLPHSSDLFARAEGTIKFFPTP